MDPVGGCAAILPSSSERWEGLSRSRKLAMIGGAQLCLPLYLFGQQQGTASSFRARFCPSRSVDLFAFVLGLKNCKSGRRRWGSFTVPLVWNNSKESRPIETNSRTASCLQCARQDDAPQQGAHVARTVLCIAMENGDEKSSWLVVSHTARDTRV